MEFSIDRPPIAKTFELPTRDELLSLKPGDFAKLIFRVGSDSPERMWVQITEQQDSLEWSGVIDNDAKQEKTRKVLPTGKSVKFYPIDIIDTMRGKN
jgi:hypothetical protein